MPLDPQSALEQAVLDAARASLGYSARDSGVCFDGRPHPRAGAVWLSVWSDGSRESNSRVALDEVMGVNVTVTVRLTHPFDRWVEHRQDLYSRLDAVRALVHKDSLNWSIVNAAAVLADLEPGTGGAPSKRIGFREALAFVRYQPWQLVGGEWFAASGSGAGIAQTAEFGRARRVQAISTAG